MADSALAPNLFFFVVFFGLILLRVKNFINPVKFRPVVSCYIPLNWTDSTARDVDEKVGKSECL